MRLVRALKPIFIGDRTHTPSDPPFEVDDRRAGDFVKAGLVELVAQISVIQPDVINAIDPSTSRSEKALARKRA
jgi:hypothetical protein